MKKILLCVFVVFLGSLQSQTLVGYWPFTGNAADSSGNGNNGFPINGTVLAYDRFAVGNRSYLFNGSDSYIIGNSPGTNFPVGSAARTITAWVNSDNLPANDRNIFHYGTAGPGSPQNYHLYLTPPGLPTVGNGYGYGVIIASQTPIGDMTWHFIAGVYEGPGTNMLRLYIDGLLAHTEQPSNVPNTGTGSNWKIGLFLAGGQPFSGRIDEVRLYDGVLSAAQIWNLYMQTTTTPGLISPPNGSQNNSIIPLLDWDSLTASTNYRIQIASDSLMTNLIWDTTVARSQVNVRAGLLSVSVLYWWRVRNYVNSELCPWSLRWSFSTTLLGIEPVSNTIPNSFSLGQNYPNPFNPKTKIKFSLPKSSFAKLIVYDALGRELETIVNEQLKAGTYEATFNANRYTSGVYYYKLSSGDFIETKKMVLLK